MSGVSEWWCHQSWPAEAVSVPAARRFVRESLEGRQLAWLVDDVALTASELATNAVRHARSPFDVTLSRAGSHVLLQVTDASPRHPSPRTSDDGHLGGRGLPLVAELGDAWGVVTALTGGKVVWVRFLV